MIAYCSESGISRQDVETALDALSLSHEDEVPVLAVRAEGREAGRVVFASWALMDMLGVADLEAASTRIFQSRDPGARRLCDLARNLAGDAAPRLERLRFFFGPVVETITFLCRKTAVGDQGPALIAAALGARSLRQVTPPPASSVAAAEPVRRTPSAFLDATEIKATLAAKLGDRRIVRFLWRTDAEGKITEITPPLAEVVGSAAADLLGRDFGDVAKHLEREPEGQLSAALAKRETFSGIEVLWPISGATAAVPVALGGVPALTHARAFDGYRGFGVIHVDRLVATEPREIVFPLPADAPLADNVIHLHSFAAGRAAAETQESLLDLHAHNSGPLSEAEESAFEEIAAALSDEEGAPEGHMGGDETPPPPADSVPEEETPAAPVEFASPPPEVKTDNVVAQSEAPGAAVARPDDIDRHAAMILERLGVGVLVSRDDVPIYANRHLLDLLGYADEDAFHAAGGMTKIFEQSPTPARQSINLRTARGDTVPVRVRLQTIDWDDLPATLFTVRRDEDRELRGKLEADVTAATSEVDELNAILDTATDGLALIDGQGRLLTLNRSAEALFGYDQSDVTGQPFTLLFAPESQAKARDYFAGLNASGVASLLNDGREVIGQPRQGGSIPIFLTLGRIGTGQEKKYCALLRDMTHWKKVEQEPRSGARERVEIRLPR
jgi:PAS domain S-box-containing protein